MTMTLTMTLRSAVGSHHLILTADDNQDAPVAEDQAEHLDAEEREEVPYAVDERSYFAVPVDVPVAHSVFHFARRKHYNHVVDNGTDPRISDVRCTKLFYYCI